jgi:hypothetical protein
MKGIAAFVLCAVWVLPAQADPPGISLATHKFGEIRGRVTYCAPGGATGAVVHLPGKSFQAHLGPTGKASTSARRARPAVSIPTTRNSTRRESGCAARTGSGRYVNVLDLHLSQRASQSWTSR